MFNVRVYGIYIEDNHILVSDEYIKGKYITKFPGGGLEEGEGTRDCLIREWMEEVNQKVETGDHIYTTDYYQKSGFGDGNQIICIYYYVKPLAPLKVRLTSKAFDFKKPEEDAQSFRMIPLTDFSAESVTLPIDKIVVEKVLEAERMSD